MQGLRAALAAAMAVTPPQYNIIMILARTRSPSGESMGRIADHLGVSLSFVVAEARALSELGLVALHRNPADRRSVLARLTKSGRSRIARVAPKIRGVNDMLFAGLTRSQFITMDGIVQRVLEGAEEADSLFEGNGRRRSRRAGSTPKRAAGKMVK